MQKSGVDRKGSVPSLSRHQMMGSVAATLDLLEIYAKRGTDELQFSDFVEESGRPKSSVHRMLATLLNRGFIAQAEGSRRYRLTLKLWRLGVPALQMHDLSTFARPHLQALMQKTDETVHLAISNGDGSIVYVSKFESQRSIRVQTQLGGSVPCYCTATGRSILANDSDLWAIVRRSPLHAQTDLTVTDEDTLAEILAGVRKSGYAVTRGEMHPEMGGVAAPIFDLSGQVVGAFGVAIPLFRMSDALVDKCVPEVLETSRNIAQALSQGA